MPTLLTCRHGHRWEASIPEDGPGACPLCGSAPVNGPDAHSETATLPPRLIAPPTAETAVYPMPPTPAEDRPDDRSTLPPRPRRRHGAPDTLVPPRPDEDRAAAPNRPTVPGYEILGELGRGGMGVVYKALHVKLHRLVALKMILAGSHARADDLARFSTEAEAVAGLPHPNIVQIYDIGEQAGLPYFSLEFVEGGSLETRLDGTPWQAPRAAQLVETLARAMHAAHQCGIIHRDLKPANVLLTADGTPKITDFGLAKRLDQDAGQTRTGTIMGTPSYMAPEQAGGAKAGIGPAADTYALGAVLYELLTGRPPFKAETPLDTILQVLGGEPVPPTQLNGRVPRDLETICLKCLQKEPAKRYATAEALADDLRRFQNHEPILARPVGRLEKFGRWCRRNPVVAGLAALVALVLVAGTAVSWYFAVQAERKARQAARRLYVADLRLVQQSWEQGQFRRVGQLLEGQTPAHTDDTDFRGFEWYYWDRLARAGLPALQEHQWGVACVAFSPDGKLLASAGWDHLINVRDAASGRVLQHLTGHADTIHGLAFSPDGRLLASAGVDKTVRLWDPASGRLVATLTGHTSTVHAVVFTPDGQFLISAGEDREEGVKVWDVRGSQPLYSLSHGDAVHSLALSPDGRRLATGGKDNVIRLWDLPGRREITTFKSHENTVAGLAFSPDGTRLASAGWDGKWMLWDSAGGPPLATHDHGASVLSVAFSPDGKTVATAARPLEEFASGVGGSEALVKLWDAADGRPLRALPGHTLAARCVAFSPDGRWLASAGEDHTVRVWDVAGKEEPRALGRQTTPLVFARDGHPLDSAADDPLVRVWDQLGGQVTLTFTRHKSPVSRVAFSPDARRLASIDWKRNLFLWDLDGHVERVTLPRDLASPQSVAFSPDGARLAVGGRDRIVIVGTSAEGTVQLDLTGHAGPVRGVACSPDGKRLASAGEDGTVRVWAADGASPPHTLRGHVGAVMAVAFAPDGRRVASAGQDGTVRVWDPDKETELLSLRGHESTVTGVAFSPDGGRLASGSSDRTVRIWEAASGRELSTLKGHSLGVTAVAFSPDDRPGVRRLASASEDGTVKLWDTAGGQEILTLRGHTDAVLGLSFSPDAHRLASSSKDSTVKVWEASD